MEGLSNAVIEAALAGLPIVGCDIGGVRDVVESGQQCLLVPPRDPQAFATAMRRYLEDNELARQHGAAARRRAEKSYAIENTLERLYSLYDQVLGTRLLTCPLELTFRRQRCAGAPEYRGPGIAVWSYMAFFLFSFFNVAGLILASLKLESLPLQPVAFVLTSALVVPMTRSKPSHPYFLVAWVFWIFFALGGFAGPHSLVGISDMPLWQLVLKLWISLIGVPFLTIRAIDRDKLPMLLKTAVVASAIGAMFAVLQVLMPGRFALILTELGRGSGFWLNPNSCRRGARFLSLAVVDLPVQVNVSQCDSARIIVIGMLTTFSPPAWR